MAPGSSISMAINRWQDGRRQVNASRSAAWRSASQQLLSAVLVCPSALSAAREY